MGNDLVANDNDPTSWAPEVFVEGGWSASGLRFANKAECERYGRLLLMRWMAPSESRATPSRDAVNYALNEDGSLRAIEPATSTGVAL